MNPLLRLLDPLRKAAAAFFKHDVALRRKEGAVHVVLERRPPGGKAKAKAKAPSREEVAARKDQEELALMRAQLADLLNDLPETRQAMRHLVFVEQALAKKGLRALYKLPLDVLQKALAQLEGLVTNWSPAGLANLRSKIAVAIIDREANPDAEADAYRTSAVLDHSAVSVVDAAPKEDLHAEDAALAAAYAALGNLAPLAPLTPVAPPAPLASPPQGSAAGPEAIELQGELGSGATKAAAREAARSFRHSQPPDEIRLRELHQ